MKKKSIKPIVIWAKCPLCKRDFRLMYHYWYYLCKDCGGENYDLATQRLKEYELKRNSRKGFRR